jgi:hypothetical protein
VPSRHRISTLCTRGSVEAFVLRQQHTQNALRRIMIIHSPVATAYETYLHPIFFFKSEAGDVQADNRIFMAYQSTDLAQQLGK